jgi:hypothetical protein
VKLTTRFHLVPNSRMRVAVPPLPHDVFMAWCLVKLRDNFTFTFYGLGPFTCSKSELTSETLIPFRHFATAPWTEGSALYKASTYIREYNGTEKRKHTSTPTAGLEATIPVFERSKITRALDRMATGPGHVGCRLNRETKNAYRILAAS